MSELVRFFLLPWWWVQRRADVRMLWPVCRDFTDSLDEAHEAFMTHAVLSPCWIEYYGRRQLHVIVSQMK